MIKVPYTLIFLDNEKAYKFMYDNTIASAKKAAKNATKMLAEGHPIMIVSPYAPLTKEDIEEYRAFFCRKAKEDKINYIYFEVPVSVDECDPLEDTMFG